MKYYIYALDTTEGILTAALSCPNEATAKIIYSVVKKHLNWIDKVKINQGNYDGFGFISCRTKATILFHKDMGSRMQFSYHKKFTSSDFEIAESRTQKIIARGEKYVREYYPELLVFWYANEELSLCNVSAATIDSVWSITEDVTPSCQIQAASGVSVPDIVEAYDTSIEDSDGSVPNVNVVNQLSIKDVREAVRYGMREGLLDTDALSKKSRQKAIQERQEDILLEQGRKPVEVARIHNPQVNEAIIRKEAQRISNDRNTRKKKES